MTQTWAGPPERTLAPPRGPITGCFRRSTCTGRRIHADQAEDASRSRPRRAAWLAASVDMATIISAARRPRDQRSFLLQRTQPVMVGLIDVSLSTLAPIFAVAFATHQPRYAFLAGLATAIGAGVSMAFSEGLSDSGELTGRGRSYLRGAITGAGTFLRHRLPQLTPLGHARRGDHRHDQRRAGRSQLTAGDASARTRKAGLARGRGWSSPDRRTRAAENHPLPGALIRHRGRRPSPSSGRAVGRSGWSRAEPFDPLAGRMSAGK
jgi:hypothetical protein